MSRYCGLCGGQVLPEDSFCPNCGARMSPNVPQAISAPEPPRPAVPLPAPVPLFAPRTVAAPPPSAPPPQAPEKMWHFILNGTTTGPVPETKLRETLQGMPGDTMVWNPSLPEWKSAEEAGLKPSPVMSPPVFNTPPASPAAPPPFAPVNRNFAPPLSSPPPAAPQFPSAFPAPSMPPPGLPSTAPIVGSPRPPYLTAPAAPQPNSPMPPNQHWLVVLILSGVTFGLGGLVWMFREAFFVKKIDPTSKAIMLIFVTLIAMALQVVITLGAASGSMMAPAVVSMVIMLLNIVIIIAGLVAVFSMRKSILTYYTTVEPIGLKLSGVMTFFFSILYFQYHFSRIIAWKKTGSLPQ